jgi:hypothetical protein
MLSEAGITVTSLPSAPPQIPFDLMLDLGSGENGEIAGSLQYDASLFSAATIEGLVARYLRPIAVATVIKVPEAHLSCLQT